MNAADEQRAHYEVAMETYRVAERDRRDAASAYARDLITREAYQSLVDAAHAASDVVDVEWARLRDLADDAYSNLEAHEEQKALRLQIELLMVQADGRYDDLLRRWKKALRRGGPPAAMPGPLRAMETIVKGLHKVEIAARAALR